MKKLIPLLLLLPSLAYAQPNAYLSDDLLNVILGGTPANEGWAYDADNFYFVDQNNRNKYGNFDASALTSGAPRTWSFKDASYILAGSNLDNGFTVSQTFAAGLVSSLVSGSTTPAITTATTLTSGLSGGLSNGIWRIEPTLSDAAAGVGGVTALRIVPSIDNATDAAYRGVQVILDVEPDETFSSGATTANGLDFIVRSSGANGGSGFNAITGFTGSAQHNNTVAPLTTLTAGSLQLSSGTGSAQVTDVNGLRFSSITSRSAWTNLYQFRGINPTISGGSIGTQYGLFLPNLTAATTNWAIFSQGGQSSHLGNFRFGSNSAPSAKVHITQSTLGDEAQRIESTATNDDPNEILYQDRVATTDATVTTLHTFTIPSSTTYMIEARVVARRTGGSAGTAEDGAGYKIYATIKNVGGTATIIGAVTADATHEDQAAWDATVDVTGATARLRVTGAANNNVTWHGTFRVATVGS